MSLFGDANYQYRDTYFVLFDKSHRPSEKSIQAMIDRLGQKFDASGLRCDNGLLESVTLHSPQDYSAIDIAYVEGEDVSIQINEIREEFRSITVRGDDLEKLKLLKSFNARLDIFHFERIVRGAGEDEFIDPGGLLLVMEELAKECQGIGYDPQSQSLL